MSPHGAVDIWLMFFDALLVSWFLRAAIVVRSSLNGIKTYWGYMQHYGKRLLLRWFVAVLGLIWWQANPEQAGALLWRYILGVGSLPLNALTVALYALAIDQLLDKVEWLALPKEVSPSGGVNKATKL